jgi:hypothetical protein
MAWLLREGFHNSVMSEYLAFTCAMAGNLHVALAAPQVDASLLRGAAELFIALANGGPAADLADYPFRHAAVAAWIEHVTGRDLDLLQLTALDSLSECEEVDRELRNKIELLRGQPQAAALIQYGLRSNDAETLERAELAALRRSLTVIGNR